VLEVSDFEFNENELNAACNSPNAHRTIKAMFAECPNVTAVDLDEKIESALVVMRLAAVDANNGAEFTFKDCRIDNLIVTREMKGALRMTTKPALDSKFGQLIERLGHTVMIQVNGTSASDQAELPLNSVAANEHGTSSIGTPEQERQNAHDREQKIAAERAGAHVNSKNTQKVKREKVDTSKRRGNGNELNA
jgi:hypothetical protein